MDRIRIHPVGTRVTDADMVQLLASKTPRSFRAAQDLLLAAQSYLSEKKGFFSSERSRIRKLGRRISNLDRALDADHVPQPETQSGVSSRILRAVEYLSAFSDTFPNWQREYEAINEFLPQVLSKG